ncbi:MAG: 50S ribosomal protein L19 [Treponema sp.]|nr:50S ribosomal protein L19 [Treponema sp.]
MMDLIKTIEEGQKRPGAQAFNVGDTVKVYFKIIEGKTERIQVFEGLVICMKNAGARRTFTVRKTSFGVGVERVFPINSPRIVKVEVVRPGKVRRAKLYYIREKIGKKAKVKQLVGGAVAAAVAARNARADAAAAQKEAEIKAEHKAEHDAAAAAKDKK